MLHLSVHEFAKHPVARQSKQHIELQKQLVLLSALCLTAVLAFVVRMFSVVRYESVIHEFDPYFNYRSTEFLAKRGPYEFINFFDSRSWYPLGRVVGPTLYPGLMVTAYCIHNLLKCIGLPVSVKDVCVFVAPLFSSLTVVVCHLLAQDAGLPGSGLFAGFLISILPAYISRSVAGSYDNEGIAIFAMVLTYLCWTRALRSGSILAAAITALAYLYMVSAWGGYVFIINLIPIHVLIMLVCQGFKQETYVAYSVFYCVGTLLSMQIQFVGFQPVQSSEHLGALAVFGLLQLLGTYHYTEQLLGSEALMWLIKKTLLLIAGLTVIAGLGLVLLGVVSPWTGRFYSLLDPSYAKHYIPIIASVAEHQSTAWSSLFNDFFISLYCFPLGAYFCIYHDEDRSKHARIFLLTYVLISLYFSSLMVRLVLVLAPGMSMLGGVALSKLCHSTLANRCTSPELAPKQASVRNSQTSRFKSPAPWLSDSLNQLRLDNGRFQVAIVCGLVLLLGSFSRHCISMSDEFYSSPSIVLSSRQRDGNLVIIDDFREAYWWLRQNTAEDAKVMSWWDYGYQLSSLANRTTFVDNNTWNNTHISRVGQAMVRPEAQSVAIMEELGVEYVLVLFGGLIGFSGDDISKSIWMIKIGASTDKGRDIDERLYFAVDGDFRIDEAAGPALKQSLLYQMCYYQFDRVVLDRANPAGFDRVRNQRMGIANITFDHLEEAFTSLHWIVRIFRVKKASNMEQLGK